MNTFESLAQLCSAKTAQQSVHLTLGILRTSQAFSYALAFFWLDGFAVPTPAQVTQTVGLYLAQLAIDVQSKHGYTARNRKV
jgi:hypothetical protein